MSSNQLGIVGYGGWVPRLRLERSAIASAHAWFDPAFVGLGTGQRAMANWDEDSVTMAVAAARDCLGGSGIPVPGSLLLASTTQTFVDRQNSVLVKEALNLSDETLTSDVSGSRRAGTTALIMALNSMHTKEAPILLLGAEKMRAKPASEAEFFLGDGAGAIAVGSEGVIAQLLGVHSIALDFVDHFRQEGSEFDYTWESRWIRDEGYGKIATKAVTQALEKCSISASEIAHFIMPLPMRGATQLVAKKVGIAKDKIYADLHQQMGIAGAAQSLIVLAHCLGTAKAGEVILVAGFGQGCDVLLFKVTDAISDFTAKKGVQRALSQGKSENNYMKYLVFNDLLSIEKGMRAEMDQKTALTALYRDRKGVLALVGGRCTRTGTIQYPKTRISVDQTQRAVDTQEDYCFADVPATILTFTADRLAYTIDPPAYYGNIVFEGGGRMVADFTDMAAEDAVVGRTMQMEFRVKARDDVRGFTRYFWKAVPVRD